MTTQERRMKRASKTYQIDQEARGRSHRGMKIITEEADLAWDQVVILFLVIHKEDL